MQLEAGADARRSGMTGAKNIPEARSADPLLVASLEDPDASRPILGVRPGWRGACRLRQRPSGASLRRRDRDMPAQDATRLHHRARASPLSPANAPLLER